ncbi:MAG: stage II sporulation protein R [Lachnospiraceae bacterium]
MKIKKNAVIILAVVVSFFLFGGFAYEGNEFYHNSLQQSIAHKVIRFHVIANSDSEKDQRLKLAVRDGIGNYMEHLLRDSGSIEESRLIVNSRKREIRKLAQEILHNRGCKEAVKVTLTHTEFPIKTYGKYTLPAGSYEALEVIIGEGEGKNWWCVLYPNLCFQNAVYGISEQRESRELKKTLTSKEYESIMDNDNYIIKFRFWDLIKEMIE